MIWKRIEGFPNYEICEEGIIRKINPKRTLTQHTDKNNIPYVNFTYLGKYYRKKVHILVAHAFLGKPTKEKPFVQHKDFDKNNNKADNLIYVSHKQKSEYYWQSEKSSNRRTKPEIVEYIRNSNLKPTELAKELNMNISTISMIINQHRCKPNRLLLKDISSPNLF